MKRWLSKLPYGIKRPLLRVRNAIQAVPYYGRGRRCPICRKSSRRFREFGVVPREDAQCPRCGALERHRLVWLFMQQRTDLFDGRPKRMLHFAPEECLAPRLRKRLGEGYVTADLFDPRAMLKLDITDIAFPDRSFDVIYCSHVLEHVPDDRRAMRELHRVLKDDGWAIVMVPITSERTFEDLSITDPEKRLRVFGHRDHLRRYGVDFPERLREAGFTVAVTGVRDLVSPDEAEEMGLALADDEIFYCTKGGTG
jgi:SAM-dependent methyltransferase